MTAAFITSTPLSGVQANSQRKPRSPCQLRAQVSPISAPPAPARTSSFGRGQQYARRHVGLYELARHDIDASLLVTDSGRNEGAFAGAVGLLTLPIVALPALAPGAAAEGPLAAACAAFMGAWAVDALALGGAGARAGALALAGRARVAAHEAGHFLVGYLLGFPVQAYALPSPRGALAGEEAGVSFGECRGRADAFRVAAAGLAGIAGELVETGRGEGGAEDLADVARGVRGCEGGASKERLQGVVRWGLVTAVLLVRQHRRAHAELAKAMREGRSVEECVEVVERFVERDALAEKAGVGLQ